MKPRFVALVLALIALCCTSVSYAQWEHLGGIRGRGTTRIVNSGLALYRLSGKLPFKDPFRSLDSGRTWSPIAGFDSLWISDIFATDSALVIFTVGSSSTDVTCWVSRDLGEHFTSTYFGGPPLPHFVPNSSFAGKDRIYVVGGDTFGDSTVNIKSTTDGGQTWSVDASNIPYLHSLTAGLALGKYVYAYSNTVFYRRNTQTGILDTMLLPKETSSMPKRTLLFDGRYLWLSSDKMSFRSLDSGGTWDTVRVGGVFLPVNGLYFYGIAFKRDTGAFVNSPFFRYWNRANDFTAIGQYGYVATDGGIFKTIVGQDNWTLVDTAIESRKVVKVYPIGTSLYAFSESGLSCSTDRGSTWTHLPTSVGVDWITESGSASRLSGTATNLWFLSTYSGIVRSKNNGTSWDTVHAPNRATKEGIIVHGGSALLGHLDGVQLTLDVGQTWRYLYRRDYVDFPLIDAGSVVYAPHKDKPMESSTDFGTTWTPVAQTAAPKLATYVAADGNNVIMNAVGGEHDTLFRSTNRGQSWARLSHRVDGATVLSVAGKRVAIGIGTAIDTSADLGSTWKRLTDTLPSVPVSLLWASDYLYAVTSDNGVFRLRTSPVSSVEGPSEESDPELPACAVYDREARAILLRNLPADAMNAAVYDVYGRQRLSQSVAAVAVAEFGVQGLPTGCYFIMLRTARGQQIFKIAIGE
jgi:photosystem II stability/assembly factor-like uncharacterized protein